MRHQKLKRLNLEPKDFSDRAYFPGTEKHPFHTINTLDRFVEKIPALLYPFLFGAVFYLLTRHLSKSIIWAGFILLDLFLLWLLPRLKISFGPVTLPMVFLAILRLPFMFFSFPLTLVFQSVGTALVIYGFMIEPQFPIVSHYQISMKTSGESSQLRVIHLSDLHMDYFTRCETRAIDKINALAPDMILFTGDFFNLSHREDPKTDDDIQTFFNRLKPTYGVYAVTGSPAVDLHGSISRILEDTDFHLIDNQVTSFSINDKQVELIGLSCTHRPHDDEKRLNGLMAQSESNSDARILLYHSPDLAPAIAKRGIDLQLSGHTHGGQVQIPFFGPIFAASLYGLKLSQGLYQLNQAMYLIVSRGLGLEGNAAPRVRFFSPPEIGLITFEFVHDNVK
jgi:predicted MPP superfamily phosphohydrolase